MKLVVVEDETAALQARLGDIEVVSSALAIAEVARAVRRRDPDRHEAGLAALLAHLRTVPVDLPLLQAAGAVQPPAVRTLDAVHLAAALRISADLDAFVCYDARLADAARAAGLRVEAPA